MGRAVLRGQRRQRRRVGRATTAAGRWRTGSTTRGSPRSAPRERGTERVGRRTSSSVRAADASHPPEPAGTVGTSHRAAHHPRHPRRRRTHPPQPPQHLPALQARMSGHCRVGPLSAPSRRASGSVSAAVRAGGRGGSCPASVLPGPFCSACLSAGVAPSVSVARPPARSGVFGLRRVRLAQAFSRGCGAGRSLFAAFGCAVPRGGLARRVASAVGSFCSLSCPVVAARRRVSLSRGRALSSPRLLSVISFAAFRACRSFSCWCLRSVARLRCCALFACVVLSSSLSSQRSL